MKRRPAERSYQSTELTVQHTDCHQHRNAPSPQCQHDSKDCIQSARLRNWCLWPPRSLVATVTCVIPVPVSKVNKMPNLGTQQCPFRRFRKFATSDYSSRHVCSSAWNNLALIGRIFVKFDIRFFSEKSVQNIQVSLKSHTINRYFT
jgi:hypothetical protein